MLSLMPFTPRYAIFYAIYPKLCYRLYHIPRSSAIFFLNVMLQYITLTPSYANSSYAMFSGQSWGRISGYCCIYHIRYVNKQYLYILFCVWTLSGMVKIIHFYSISGFTPPRTPRISGLKSQILKPTFLS